MRQFVCLLDEGGHDALGVLVRHLGQDHIAGVTLDERGDEAVPGAGNQVALPMAGDGTVLYGCGSLPDRDGVLDLTKPVPLQTGVPGAADRACRPQMGQQFLLQNASGLDEQASIDRLMGHAALLVVGICALQPPCNLLWRPLALKPG